ncbi:hypothetical protein BLOT_002786 [Blomia tropicalis]|nr:hypothetical protein BLOT_002786 [Blomia tropicalis]
MEKEIKTQVTVSINNEYGTIKNESIDHSLCFFIRIIFILILFGSVLAFLWYESKSMIDIHDRSKSKLNIITNGRIDSNEMDQRRLFIREMVRDAWSGYVRFAWQQDALEPVTRSAYQQWLGIDGGLSLIQGMTTLLLMDMPEEFARGRQWIAEEFNFTNINHNVNVFLAVTELIGSLLSCFALTNDGMFVHKAREIADALEPTYQTVKGLPMKSMNPFTGIANGNHVYLSEIGGQQLEYHYLYMLTGDYRYERRIKRIRKHLYQMDHPQKLYMNELNVDSGEWSSPIVTLFASSSTFYSYLIKSYLQSHSTDIDALQMYIDTINGAIDSSMFATMKIENIDTMLLYVRDMYNIHQSYGQFMIHDGCYLGSMLALGAVAIKDDTTYSNLASQHWQLALNITETCQISSINTKTGLPPYFLLFVNDEHLAENSYFNQYFLSPELAETYFILWRLTHDIKYREYAWQMVQSIYKHCRTKNGYSTIFNVDQIPTIKSNYQSPQLFATLKYLYLTFMDDDILPIGQWVFNRIGQPLPICYSKLCKLD